MDDDAQDADAATSSARVGLTPALFAVATLGLVFVGARLHPILACGEAVVESGLTLGAALALGFGLSGLTTAWWSPVVRVVTRGRAAPSSVGHPAWLFTLGVIAAAPAVTYLGAAMWADAAFSGRAWEPELAGYRPFLPIAAVGIPVVVTVAWRVCFAPFRRAWPRWIPLLVVLLGLWIAVSAFPERVMAFDPLFHALPAAVALAWAIALGFASPRQLGLTPDPHPRPDPLDWLTSPSGTGPG